jgi:cation diffusion facilitator CzcD-associated flavoprotein CzcO
MGHLTAAAIDHDIGIIGAGFGGLLAALQLKLSGRHSFVVLERAARVGGVWRENVYPGCACDVQSHLYCLAARPNPDWSANYAAQPEILAYLENTARRDGLDRHIRFGTDIQEARFSADQGSWGLLDQHGNIARVRVLILALGSHNRPHVPAIPGLDRFAGTAFHSSAWDRGADLAGKRVAVIGTGASAIQIVPSLAPIVAQLSVFQRTPAWVVPRGHQPVSRRMRKLYRSVPAMQALARLRHYWMLEAAGLAVLGNPLFGSILTGMARRNIAQSVSDATLRRRLTPEYQIGCKRILVSDDYYPAFNRNNVELITEPIAAFTPDAVRIASGRDIAADAVILATGFRVADPQGLLRIVAADGRTLSEQWAATGMQAYLGIHASGFPNMAMLMGPNSGPPSASAIHVMESQMNYILRYIDAIEPHAPGSALDVRPERQRAYNDWLQQRLQGTAWNSGCASWYLDRTGRNTTMYPGLTSTYRRRTARFDPRDYLVSAPVTAPAATIRQPVPG